MAAGSPLRQRRQPADARAVRVRRGMIGAGAVAGAGVVALLVLVPPGQTPGAGPYPACPFKALTGLDCPFCGGLRGTHELLTGNLAGAGDQNILIPMLAVLALGITSLTLWRHRNDQPAIDWEPVLRRVGPFVVAFIAVFWVARNLAFVPFLHSGIG